MIEFGVMRKYDQFQGVSYAVIQFGYPTYFIRYDSASVNDSKQEQP